MTTSGNGDDLSETSVRAFRSQAYDRLCESYHAIDTFRGILLGALPLASGTGIVVLFNKDLFDADGVNPGLAGVLAPLGAFGFLVTLGLACYEAYGIRRCTALILTGQRLEERLGLDKDLALFRGRPDAKVNEPLASGIVYGAVLAAWLYVALSSNSHGGAALGAALVFAACIVAMKRTQGSAESESGPR